MSEPDPPPLIIGGCHRSGTTLLRLLLNRHPRIFCPSEVKFYRDLLGDYAEDPLAHLRLGRTIEALGLPRDVWLAEMGAALVRCYGRAAAAHGKPRWADKNPENVLHIGHWDRLLRGRLHFVLVVRHPFDVAASMIETPMPRTIVPTDEGRARHIRTYVEAGLRFLDANPERSTLIRYEDLTADPGKALSALLERVDEAFEPAMIAEPPPAEDAGGLGDPKARTRAIISSDSVGRWQRDLSAAQVAALAREVANLMPRLGYGATPLSSLESQ